MSIAVVCGACAAKLNAPDAAANRRLKCPKCGESILVPEPEAEFKLTEVESDRSSHSPSKPEAKPFVDNADEDGQPVFNRRPRSSAGTGDGDNEADKIKPRRKKAGPPKVRKSGINVLLLVGACVFGIALLGICTWILLSAQKPMEWHDFVKPEFAVRVRSAETARVEQSPAKPGLRSMVTYSFGTKKPNGVQSVCVMTLDDDRAKEVQVSPTKHMDEAIAGGAERMKGTILTKTDSQLDGKPARDAVLMTDIGRFYIRIAFHGNKVFMLLAGAEGVTDFQHEHVMRFFSSFKFTSEPEPPPPPDVVLGPIYQPKGDVEQVALSASVNNTCLGGGGRFIILLLGVKKIGIFDAELAKVVKEIDFSDVGLHFAAGRSRLVAVDWRNRTIRSWNLVTFLEEKQRMIPDTISKSMITEVCMGSLNDEILFINIGDDQYRTYAVDLGTMNTSEVRWSDWNRPTTSGRRSLRASADATVLTSSDLQARRSEVAVFKEGKQIGTTSLNLIPPRCLNALALPSTDGRLVFANGQVHDHMVTSDWQNPATTLMLPSVQPGFVMAFEFNENDGASVKQLAKNRPVRVFNEDRTLLFELPSNSGFYGSTLPWDKSIFYYPKSGLLVTLNESQNQLALRRFDLREKLEETMRDYLVVTSRPPKAVVGQPFVYQIEVLSKIGGVKYKLESGPKEMTVDEKGKVVWEIATALEKSRKVVVKVTDASGQHMDHAFELGTKPGWQKN